MKERIETINLSRVYWGRKANRAARAVRLLREWVKRRLHAERVVIDDAVNKVIWSRGIEKPPRKIRVKIKIEETREVKTKSGETRTIPTLVRVMLAEEGGSISE